MTAEQSSEWFRSKFEEIRTAIGGVIVGQREVVEGVLMGLAANGHVLLEGMPGLGKTLLVRSLAQAVDLSSGRIQFTPDLMPADVTGTNILSQSDSGERRFEFRRGPIFTNVLLADEINRATPKTQSALLEAMQERFVTAAGIRHQLEEPFMVMATQNPIEQEGTYPLPEAQLDRFFLKLIVPYPSREELANIVTRTTGSEMQSVPSVANREDVLRMRDIVREVAVAQNVLDFALSIVLSTQPHPENPIAMRCLRYGSSPRGAQSVVTAAKIYALLDGRYNVAKEDILRASKASLRHRIGLSFEAEADAMSADTVLDRVIENVQQADKDPISV